MNKAALISLLALGAGGFSSVEAKERARFHSQARTPVETHRVRFARGHSSVIVSGVAGFENWEPLHNYHVRAKAGQTLDVRLLSGQGRAQFDVYNSVRRGIFVPSGGEDTTHFRSKLPYSGDYVVSIYGIKPSAKYRVRIAVK